MAIHDGHRERLRDMFRENGLAGFDQIRALELLLQYSIPRRDTNPVAHALLERFGSLSAVFDAGEEELCEVEGVGPHTALLLRLLPQIMRKSEVERASTLESIQSARNAWRYLRPRYLYERDEVAVLLCLDNQKRVIRCVELARGVVNSVDVDVRKTVETALKLKASSVILAHNHPNGRPVNSREDDAMTQRLYQALQLVGISLSDHVILAEDQFFSYLESGTMGLLRYSF